MTPHEALSHGNVRAFLRVIRAGESSQDESAYTVRWGGSHFSGFAAHPSGVTTSHGVVSSAAGAYQFLAGTWREVQEAMGLPDFSPASQDLGAVYLVRRRGALDDVIAGRIAIAVQKCRLEWTSFQTVAISRLQDVSLPYGGVLAGDAVSVDVVVSPPAGGADVRSAAPPPPISEYEIQGNMPAAPAKEVRMVAPALITALLPSIIESIPRLGKIFAAGEVATRNVEAAGIVLETVRKATGAANEQEAVAKLKSDPVALQAAQQAVQDRWFDLVEAGGGGIEGARKASETYFAPGHWFWLNPSFWVSCILLSFPLMLLIDLFYAHPANYDKDLRVQIVTAVLVIIGMVGGYWIGTSVSSARKDAAK